ncbi:hypothetical protein EL22_26615 [Halostagnicola sp. A56]|uniref:UvrD-helicase domain-containing protein n=1 Tax=Halostagnicola sp. A56 TaxID=1495067 RepID=UPI00065F6A5C|nr:UvrD-helicase domain-containing protein [Halostagnicola sp. A56]KMT45875.1 hypothetical protein EL22_26615 [Halostagnicola sp. A56]
MRSYNAEFVEQELERYAHLVTDVDEMGHDLNEDQQKAIVRDDEYNQVIAGVGTGKTLVLTHRIAYLIERGVNPERIVAITLTNEATDEIQDRLEDRFGITDVEVHTIHGFANAIAREARTGRVDVITDHQRTNIVEEVLREKTSEGGTDFARHYRQFLANYQTEVPELGEFESRAAYVEAVSERSYETLAGEEVASQAEKTIADFCSPTTSSIGTRRSPSGQRRPTTRVDTIQTSIFPRTISTSSIGESTRTAMSRRGSRGRVRST